MVIEIAVGIMFTGGVLTIENILAKLGQAFKELGDLLIDGVKGLYKAGETTIAGFMKGIDWLLEFLSQGTDEILKLIDEVFGKVKKGGDDSLNGTKNLKLIQKMWDDFSYEDLLRTPPSKKPCFLAGTLIKAEHGYIRIEEITAAQKVYARNFENNSTDLKTVLQTFQNTAETYICIHTERDVIKATGQHRFWVPALNTWVLARNLIAGMELLNAENLRITINRTEILSNTVVTYNLEVEDHHNYFVGRDALLTHNKSKVSIFSITDLNDVEFYILEDYKRNPLYLGKTGQGFGVRFEQHRFEYKKAPLKKAWFNNVEGGKNLRINNIKGPFKMTPYEVAVTEMFEIATHGGIGQNEVGLFNKQKPIGNKKFEEYKKLFNPCKLYV